MTIFERMKEIYQTDQNVSKALCITNTYYSRVRNGHKNRHPKLINYLFLAAMEHDLRQAQTMDDVRYILDNYKTKYGIE